jgi:hypothetical protein
MPNDVMDLTPSSTKIMRGLREFSRHPHQLYLGGDDRGQPIPGRWYMTGPRDRPNYVHGPISEHIVAMLVARQLIEPDVYDRSGMPIAYRARAAS